MRTFITHLFATLLTITTTCAFVPNNSHLKSLKSDAAAFTIQPKSALGMTSSTGGNPFQSLFGDVFKKPLAEPKQPKLPDCVVDPDYNLAILFVIIGAVILLLSPADSCNATGPGFSICPPSIFGSVAGGLHILLGSFFAVQASNIRFIFDETAFELKRYSKATDSLEPLLMEESENIIVGGQNRWKYGSFVNWDFFPSADFPILVYFKENQTPSEMWNKGPGSLDKVGGGQLHFFPAIANVKVLKEQFELRGCAKVDK